MPDIIKNNQDFLASEFVHNFRGNSSAIIGSVIIIFFIFIVVFGPSLVRQNPYDLASLELMDAYKPPVWLPGGDIKFILGTDGQGRDLLASIVYGTRISLLIGLAAMLCSSLIGATLGLIAGYYGGRWDSAIMRIADVQLSFVVEIAPLLHGLSDFPNLAAFRERIHARPAYKSALAKGGRYDFGPAA